MKIKAEVAEEKKKETIKLEGIEKNPPKEEEVEEEREKT